MRLTNPAALAGAVVALVLTAVIGASAYSVYGKWATTPILIYANPSSPDVSATAIEAALQVAMNAWNNTGKAVKLSYAGRSNDTSASYNGRSVVMFRNTTNGSAIASTYAWSKNGALVEADTVFWDGGRQFFTGTSGCTGSYGTYVEDIATHELGHALGLSHSGYSDATMYGKYAVCSQALRTLAADDVNAMTYLYSNLTASNTAPSVTLAKPTPGSYSKSTAILFSGSALDNQDGNISSKLVWSSNINGTIGTGASFSRTLSAGAHTITAKVTDSGGLTTARAVATISVY